MARRIERFVPGLAIAGFEHRWHGVASLTPDFLPRFWRVGPGALAVTACNGRGIALNTALGPVLARHLCGEVGEDALPVPVTDPQPLRHPRLSAAAPGAMLLFAGLHDRWAK
jgi:glycine/D-amino acid oxidase-like deaminating enzyme